MYVCMYVCMHAFICSYNMYLVNIIVAILMGVIIVAVGMPKF